MVVGCKDTPASGLWLLTYARLCQTAISVLKVTGKGACICIHSVCLQGLHLSNKAPLQLLPQLLGSLRMWTDLPLSTLTIKNEAANGCG